MEEKKLNEAYEKTYFKMLNFVSYRLRSEKEVLDRLEKYLSKFSLPKDSSDSVKSKVLSKLEDDGYLNDVKFASSYVKGLIFSNKPVSNMKIFQFLLKRGVPKEVIMNVLSSDLPSDFLLKNALKEGEKKKNSLRDVNPYTLKRKLLDYLYKKGYPSEVIHSVIDSLL